jgi:hypothetical protein
MVAFMVQYATAAIAALLLLPVGASAQGSQSPASDPEADSPSGVVYELPLEKGRKDAAPRNSARRKATEERGGSVRSGGSNSSPIRSENRFGSSSQVPGVDDDRADAGGAAGGSGGDGDGRAGGGSGSRDSVGDQGTAAAAVGTAGIDPAASSSEGPSWGLVVPLLALLLLLGVTAGALAGRARRA